MINCIVFYFFFTFKRLLFVAYNTELLHVEGFAQLMKLCFYGIPFDATAIFYINSLFILASVLPWRKTSNSGYQKVLFYFYMVPNAIAITLNFIDFIYYRYTYTRSGSSILDSVVNEENKAILAFNFMINYWHVFVLYGLTIWLWVYLYRKVKVKPTHYDRSLKFYSLSVLGLLLTLFLSVGAIRGDYKKTTRPKNLVDANKNLDNIVHADIVLNTPFVLFRTISKHSFKKVSFVSDAEISKYVKPIKQYQTHEAKQLNVVLLIVESFGREYSGAFNTEMGIENFQSYTPFIDSLAQHSMIYNNAYSNGSKSIHGMSSVLAGIPSFKDAFTSSPYPNQPIESLVSIFNDLGYDTSFFHGSPNGSMGFQGFGSTLGFDHYYGMTEYNDDADFDGTWGIWDEPFFQFMKTNLDQKKEPFFATMFTVSSHEPYKIPEKYLSKFPKGNVQMHSCIAYTDFAIQEFMKAAAKEDWFQNTLFVITADHGNQTFYSQYNEPINRQAIPILFYHPASQLKGVSNEWAQQIDIYPTILDYLGYQKPFRSWGRSLLSEQDITPFCINYSGNQYQFMKDNYICIFDGQKATGFYDPKDFALKRNLIHKRTAAMDAVEKSCQSFLQDYFQKIIDRNLK